MLRLISRGFNSVDYGLWIIALQITLMAQNHIVFSRNGTLEVNYLSVSARSDARVLLYGERPLEMHSHYSRVRRSLSCAVRMIIALF